MSIDVVEMNDFLTKIKELCNSTIVYWILVGVTVFGVCYGASWLKNRYSGSELPAADVAKGQIESAREHQRAISSSLYEAETGAGNVSSGIEKSQAGVRNAQESASNIEAAIAEQRRLIGECQSIIRDIQEGAAKETSNN